MKKQIKNGVEKASSFALPKLDEELAMKTYGRGDGPIHYGGTLPEVVITPSGDNYIDYGDGDIFDFGDDWDTYWAENGDGGATYSGGDVSGGSSSNTYKGQDAAAQFSQDLNNGDVIAIQGTLDPDGNSSFAKSSDALQEVLEVTPDIMTLLGEDPEVLEDLGGLLDEFGLPLENYKFFVGLANHDYSASTWCAGAQAIIGDVIVLGVVSDPIVAAGLGVVSFCIGVYELVTDSSDSGSGAGSGSGSGAAYTGYYN